MRSMGLTLIVACGLAPAAIGGAAARPSRHRHRAVSLAPTPPSQDAIELATLAPPSRRSTLEQSYGDAAIARHRVEGRIARELGADQADAEAFGGAPYPLRTARRRRHGLRLQCRTAPVRRSRRLCVYLSLPERASACRCAAGRTGPGAVAPRRISLGSQQARRRSSQLSVVARLAWFKSIVNFYSDLRRRCGMRRQA